jgi:hypothetical protein
VCDTGNEAVSILKWRRWRDEKWNKERISQGYLRAFRILDFDIKLGRAGCGEIFVLTWESHFSAEF